MPAEKDGLVTIDTPRTQAFVGFLSGDHKPLRNLRVEIRNRFAAMVLSSLDGSRCDRSGKMLLTAGSRVANTGMKWHTNRAPGWSNRAGHRL